MPYPCPTSSSGGSTISRMSVWTSTPAFIPSTTRSCTHCVGVRMRLSSAVDDAGPFDRVEVARDEPVRAERPTVSIDAT